VRSPKTMYTLWRLPGAGRLRGGVSPQGRSSEPKPQ